MTDDTPHLMHPDVARVFILAGNASFSVVSKKTGAHYSYKVMAPEKGHDVDKPVRFCSLRTSEGGAFFGSLWDGRRLSLSGKAKIDLLHPGVQAFRWFVVHVLDGTPESARWDLVDVFHAGRCGRCGRELTDPTSIERGFGAECRKLRGE